MGERNDRKRVEKWLRREMTSDETFDKVVIRQVLGGNKLGTVIGDVEVNPSSDNDYNVLADEIIGVCELDVEGFGNLQSYVLVPQANGKPRNRGRLVLRVAPGENVDSENLDSEPANRQGLTAQLMRHLEGTNKTMALGMGQTLTIQARMLDTQAQLIDHLMSKHVELVTTVEDALSMKHEREMQLEGEKIKQERQREIVQKLDLILPVAINRLAGKNVIPMKNGPQKMLLNSVLGSLTQEQMSKLVEVLKPEQTQALLELYQMAQAEEAAKNGAG